MRGGAGRGGALLGGGIVIALLTRLPAAAGQPAAEGRRAGAWAPASSPSPAGGAPRLRAAVASESSRATQEALKCLRSGGNAVDAAVSATLVAGVTSPTSSGIGGGGFVLSWNAPARSVLVLDFRETAPRAVESEAFERRPFPAEERGRLVGVPGELKGLYELHRRAGRLAWAEVVAPAVRAAQRGYSVGPHLASMLSSARGRLPADPGLARVYYPAGHPLRAGHLARNPGLGRVLSRVAAEGPPAFYEGALAHEIVDTAKSAGGALELSDLRDYSPVEREPLEIEWDGHRVYTMPPPSAGGIMLAQVLGTFGRAELARLGIDSGAYQHLLAEAMRAALADRMRHLGASDDARSRERLLEATRLSRRKRALSIDRTHAIPRFDLDRGGTHHLVTSDPEGNVVSLTTTINTVFGAKLTTPSGVVLNDELDDFTSSRDVATLGLDQSPNRARPGARPVSSMTPTIVVKDGRVVLALGGSGGFAIATNVTQAALARLVFGLDVEQIVNRPRFYVPAAPDATLWLEPGASPDLRRDLEWRGELVGVTPFTKSAVQVLVGHDRGFRAAADPRKHGSAGTW